MTIGLVILGISAVLLFFGVAEKFFDRLGLTSWLAFLLILALIVGAVTPELRTDFFVITVGGFIVPLVVGIILFAIASRQGSFAKTLLSVFLVTSVATLFRIVMSSETVNVLASNLIIGFVCGAVAFLCAGSRLGALAGGMLGVDLGDLISAISYAYILGEGILTLGSGIFDGIIISTAFALVVAEIAFAITTKMERRKTEKTLTEAEFAKDENNETLGEEESEKLFKDDEDDRL
ncbi:MAG: hypothetical protein IKM44_03625 [Clostridia bacterium]|nr:hypothetical protein [Clostridia bacterium]